MKTNVHVQFQKILVGVSVLGLFIMGGCKSGSSYSMEAADVILEPAVEESENIEPQNENADTIFNTEEYNRIYENPFKEVVQNPLSTFSIDVDNASYSNVRRYLNNGEMPPADAIRIEEMINYFDYNYPQPTNEHPFSIYKEVATCPWNKDHLLVHIGLQGKKLDYENLKPCNLVFLIDVSGSMDEANKLPLVKMSLTTMLENLQSADRVALVVYSGSSGLVLPSTSLEEKDDIIDAIDDLDAGGSTAGGEGLQLAYKVAAENYKENGNNRVILCTDGDFNIGISSTSELVKFIEEQRKKDIYLTICGFGMGNYKDGRLEEISDAGNGNYFYIDQESEAEKVFNKELRANLFTIAKDVKIQVEFNPQTVEAYRLIGYENRMLNKEDFNDDKKDAGELGAGHTVTALYEVVPVGKLYKRASVDPLKYQKQAVVKSDNSGDLLTIKLRYKPVKSDDSKLLSEVIGTKEISASSSNDFKFAAAVAEFGMLLRASEYKGDATFNDVLELAGNNNDNEKREFTELVQVADKMNRSKN
jgi:Ca-activated chloride channel family protein